LDCLNDEEAFLKAQNQLKEKRGDLLVMQGEAKLLNPPSALTQPDALDVPATIPGDYSPAPFNPDLLEGV